MNRGVYFLANDRVYENALTFLNSFRTYNPTIPLCLIPYADDSARVRDLADRLGFTIWRDDEALLRCDRVSHAFFPEAGARHGLFRKLAAWSGEFDEFIYIDCDTVVLRPVDYVFDFLDRYAFITGSSNFPGPPAAAWSDSIYQTGALTVEQIEYAANTGFIASRRDLLNLDQVIADKLPKALVLAPHMALRYGDQPFLNYLMVTSDLPYTSLGVLASDHEANPDLPIEQWGGMEIGTVRDGVITPPEYWPPALFVHWAGEFQRAAAEGGRIMHHDLWSHYHDLTLDVRR